MKENENNFNENGASDKKKESKKANIIKIGVGGVIILLLGLCAGLLIGRCTVNTTNTDTAAYNAYKNATNNGYVGTYEEWISSLGQGSKGDKGETGPAGAQGEKGDKGETGDKGDAGVSIVSVTKTSSDGNVDTYTIAYSDGTTSTFTVTNGEDGQQGIQGEKGDKGETGQAGAQGEKGDKGETGDKGDAGVSIVSVTKTSSDGNVDTYTITFSDNSSTTFTVTNGTDGASWSSGKGAPTSTGNIGDFYFDTESGKIYSFKGTGWVEVFSYEKDAVIHTVNLHEDASSISSTKSIEDGKCISDLTCLSKGGYSFEGWFTTTDRKGIEYTKYTPVYGDLDLYARWTNPFIKSDIDSYVTKMHEDFNIQYSDLANVDEEIYGAFLDQVFVVEHSMSEDELTDNMINFQDWLYSTNSENLQTKLNQVISESYSTSQLNSYLTNTADYLDSIGNTENNYNAVIEEEFNAIAEVAESELDENVTSGTHSKFSKLYSKYNAVMNGYGRYMDDSDTEWESLKAMFLSEYDYSSVKLSAYLANYQAAVKYLLENNKATPWINSFIQSDIVSHAKDDNLDQVIKKALQAIYKVVVPYDSKTLQITDEMRELKPYCELWAELLLTYTTDTLNVTNIDTSDASYKNHVITTKEFNKFSYIYNGFLGIANSNPHYTLNTENLSTTTLDMSSKPVDMNISDFITSFSSLMNDFAMNLTWSKNI